MIYIENPSHSCFYNHAAEEYAMEHYPEDIFSLWINSPSILIGRNQDTLKEINAPYVNEHGIDIVRRISGGGAVFNDHGNINFTFITDLQSDAKANQNSFLKFASPVIEALNQLGVKAEFSGRNDAVIDGQKYSGNAQYFSKTRVLHHGTLLFDVDMRHLSKALSYRPQKYQSRSISSNQTRVTNIRPHLPQDMSLLAFREYLKDFIIHRYAIASIHRFTFEETNAIEALARHKYQSWEWNYGKNPPFACAYAIKHPFGLLEYGVSVKSGKIRSWQLKGDFFGKRPVEELIARLEGTLYQKEALLEAVREIKVEEYIQGMEASQLVEDLLSLQCPIE